ncbi:hypothetical protein ACNKHP_19695 [Shigella boydii]
MTHGYAGAMVFGIVIVNAARSRGVTEARLLTRYTVWGWPDGGCWSDSAVPGVSSGFRQRVAGRSSLQTALLFCMLTFSTPLAAAVASCGGVKSSSPAW